MFLLWRLFLLLGDHPNLRDQWTRMAYQYPSSGFPGFPGYPGGDASYPPGQQAFPGGQYPPGGAFPPAAGGGYPQAGGFPAPGGFPGAVPSYPGAPGFGTPGQGPGYGAPPGAPGYGAPQGVPGYGGPGFGAPAAGGYGAPAPGGYGAPAPGGYGAPAPGGYGAPAAGGYGAPAAGGFGAPPGGAPGYGGYQQPSTQSYGGGGPGQAPGGFPSGPAPGQQPAPFAAAMTATQGTIRASANFDALADAEKLRKAMKGFGTDEQTVIDVIANRSNDQRQKIKAAFKTAYGKDLIKDLKSELSGHVEDLIVALFMPPTYYDAYCVYNAMKGAGTKEGVLIEILCSRTNVEIRNIVACYKSEFGRDIEKDIRSDTSGHFERLLVSMCQANRDESTNVNMQQVEQDAQRLYQAGEGKLGTDESSFNLVLASRSFPHLKAVTEAYARLSKRDLISAIGREFSGHIEDGLKAILQCAINRPAYFAERLYKSMKGAGTKDSTLIRVIVTRSEIDLVQVKQAFVQMYQKSVASMIQSDTSGDYRKLLLAIAGQ
ncbi:annexin A7 isoform X2 [Bufo gargarizans]|uniref:annexin A7 isoform X2 n=1 Tax=Bufo gargarizans TaxID=30331 RepID=UPI001CF56F21|nr:annexin A7 isoform X2 [Bufo gargarizans]